MDRLHMDTLLRFTLTMGLLFTTPYAVSAGAERARGAEVERGVADREMLVEVDDVGFVEQSQPLDPHALRRSFATLDLDRVPDTFVLTGAGWGHGVGLCQIGAAVMACRGSNHRDILKHYYPGTKIERFYA